MSNPLDKFDEYIEALLLAQYDVSEDVFPHVLTRGETREDFLKVQIKQRYPTISCLKGCIASDKGQSTQIDVVIPRHGAQHRTLGDQTIIDSNDVLFVIEIKSRATGTDLKDLNATADLCNSLASRQKPKVGLFCYYYDLKLENLLRRFGYIYDKTLGSFELQDNPKIEYPNIDFMLALDKNDDDTTGEKRSFFVVRDVTDNKFILYREPPVSKHFFKLLSPISE
jgi:hypothetical protein